MRRFAAGALATTAVVLLSGCGGQHLDSGKVASCLRGENFTVSHLTVSSADADYVARDLLYVRGRATGASVSFGDVEKLERTYGAAGHTDERADALVVWDRYEAASGKRLLRCLE